MTQLTNLRGVVRGRTIELDEPIAIEEGEIVEVTISRTLQQLPEILSPGDGIRRSAGAWAEDAEQLDEFLEWNRQQRKQSRAEIEP